MSFVIDKQGEYLPVLGETTGGGSTVTVDSALSTESTNPVQNAVITNTLNDKADKDLSNITETGKGVITNIAMPSATYDSITGGASGTQYTAPADGWYFIGMASGSGGGGWSSIQWEDGLSLYQNATQAEINMTWIIPIRKGVKISIVYMSGVHFNVFRFYYC